MLADSVVSPFSTFAHLIERSRMVLFTDGNDAVGRNHDFEVTHVGVVPRKQHTTVGTDTR